MDCIHATCKINFKIAEVCICEKDWAMIFFGGHNNLIMVCEPLLPFRVKSYVSDWSRRDNLLESNNSILISDMLSTWNRKEYIIMRVPIKCRFFLPILELVGTSFIIFADSGHSWVNTLKRSEAEIWKGQVIYVGRLLDIWTSNEDSRRFPPLGPSPGWKHHLAFLHLRHYWDTYAKQELTQGK